ncbi:cation:proton antiporter [Proteinivorax hydrogeniformans]|uniref:Cation:proton antiporter n=1 Tax=Proteinivorax hydrogeniformans TaxID=1826727 RepID=A0AAU8HTX3_9FIRM
MLLSLIIIITLGIISKRITKRIGLPHIIGLIFLGWVIGPFSMDLIVEEINALSEEIRMLALIIILVRAGIGLNISTLKKVGKTATLLSFIPCIFEGLTVTVLAMLLFDLDFAIAGVLGFVLAAVSPAVIVPSMLKLKERGWGMDKGVPVLVLAAASVDDVVAITLLTSFLSMAAQGGSFQLVNLGRIPYEIVVALILGAIVALALNWVLKKIDIKGNDYIGFVFTAAIAIYLLGQVMNIAGLLGIMSFAFVLKEKAGQSDNQKIKDSFASLWYVGEIFLFILIGAQVDISVIADASILGLLLIFGGVLARGLGVMLATIYSDLNIKERLFIVLAFVPKATVQAAVGGMALSMGLAFGEEILAIAVLSIIVTAPLGAWLINTFAPKLLIQQKNTD